MVAYLNQYFCLLAQQAAVPEKLPPPERAAVLMALIAILLLGMLLVVIILLGGHWVRRWGSYRRGPAVPPDFQVGTKQATSAPDETRQLSTDDSSTNDTVQIDDTMVS